MGIRNREGALYLATGVDTTGLYAGRREAMGIIKAMAGQITSFDVFSGIGISAATAFASAAKSSYEFEKEFHKNMLEVATISTQVSGNMTDFMNRVVSITQQIPITAPEAAKALYQIVSAGHDGADGMKILEVSAKSAVGGLMDTATAADAITTILNAYKLSADEAQNISDQLFTTVRLGKTDFGQLGQSIAQVAPIAAAYGISVDEVLGSVASLTKQGTPTSQAMTQVRAAIQGTAKELGDAAFKGRTFQEALQSINERAGGSASKMKEMLGTDEGLAATLALTGKNAKAAASDLNELQSSAGATEAAFEKMKEDVDNQMKLLSNNIHAALRPMGEAILKEVSDVAKSVNEAFANGDAKAAMKSLGDLIVIVTGAFIGYKGAVLTSTAAQNLHTKAILLNRLASIQQITTTQLLTNAIKAQTIASLKNVAALATNPYFWAAAAIAALGYGIYKYATQATAAEKAQQNLNARWEEQKKLTEERKTKTEELLNVAQDETLANIERNKALKTLKELYPQIFAQYDLEALKLADILQLKKQISEQDVQRNYQSDKEYFASLAAKHDKLNEEISYRSQNYGNGQHKYGEFFNKTTSKLEKEREIVSDEMNKLYANLKEKSEMIWETSPREVKIISLEQNIASLKKEKQELEKLLSPNTDYVSAENTAYNPLSSVVSPDAIARLNVVNDLLQTQSTQLDQLNQQAEGENKNEETVLQRKLALSKELAAAEAKLKKLRAADSTATDSEIDQAEKKVEEKKKALKALTGLSEKEGDQRKQAQQELSRAILDSELKLQAERIAIMKDGKDKRVLLADQEYKQTLATIQKEREEYQKKVKDAGGAADPTVLATYDNREVAAENKRNTDVAAINKEYVEEYTKRSKALTEIFLSEEEKRLSAVKERYDEERKWAKEQHETGGMSDEEYESYSTTINEAETQENLKALLDKYKDYDTKRRELEKNYTDEIATLSSRRTEANKAEIDAAIAEADKRRREELAALDDEAQKKTSIITKLFSDMSSKSVAEIRSIADEAQKMLDYVNDGEFKTDSEGKGLFGLTKEQFDILSKSPEKLQAIKDEIANVRREADQCEGSFAKMSEGLKKVFSAGDDTKKLKDGLADIEEGMNDVMEVGGFLSTSLSNLGDALGSEALNGAAESINAAMDAANSAMSGAKAGAMFGPWGAAAGAAIGLVSSLGSSLAKLHDAKHEKKIQRIADQIEVLDKSYEKLSDSIEKAYSTDASKMIEQQNELLEQQKVLIQQQIREEEEKKKTDKDRIKEWREQIEDIDKTLADNEEKAKDAIFGEDLKSAIDNFAEAYAEAWAGGEDRAMSMKEVAKNMIKQTIIELIKSSEGLGETVKKIREMIIGYLSDGVVDEWEQRELDAYIDSETARLDAKYGWADKYLKEDKELDLGVSSDSLADTIIDGLRAGKTGIKDFSSSFEDMMKTAVLNSLKAKYLEGPLKEFQKKFAELSESGGQLTEAEIEELRQMYADIIKGANTQFDALKEVSGLDFFEDSDNTLKGAFAKASQESIDLLAGQAGAQRVAIENIREQMRFIYDLQKQGWQDVKAIRDLTAKIDRNSEQVADNTRLIHEVAAQISESTKKAAESLDSLDNRGIKVKM